MRRLCYKQLRNISNENTLCSKLVMYSRSEIMASNSTNSARQAGASNYPTFNLTLAMILIYSPVTNSLVIY